MQTKHQDPAYHEPGTVSHNLAGDAGVSLSIYEDLESVHAPYTGGCRDKGGKPEDLGIQSTTEHCSIPDRVVALKTLL